MGWNTWNHFACDYDEQLLRDTADIMVESGLAKAGYVYLNMDDCWMAQERSADGHLVPDPIKFPSSLEALSDYVHSKGLKLGIYSSAGNLTCAKFPASLGKEDIDA